MTSLLLSICCSLVILFSTLDASNAKLAAKERKLVRLVNAEREKLGLKRLKIWKALTHCARKHSKNMASKRVKFGHNGFKGRSHAMRKKSSLLRFGENCAYSLNVKDHLKTAVSGWMKSPGHYANIVGAYEETGIGIAIGASGSFYATQLFAKRAP